MLITLDDYTCAGIIPVNKGPKWYISMLYLTEYGHPTGRNKQLLQPVHVFKHGLVISTFELSQIYHEAKRFGKAYNIKVVCAYGGGSLWEQCKACEEGAEIIVATPVSNIAYSCQNTIMSISNTSHAGISIQMRMKVNYGGQYLNLTLAQNQPFAHQVAPNFGSKPNYVHVMSIYFANSN